MSAREQARPAAEAVRVVITGPDGVGKTTVASAIARRLGLRALLEQPEKIDAFQAWLKSPTPERLLESQLAFLEDAADRQLAIAGGGICERSVHDNCLVMAQAYYNLGLISPSALVALRRRYAELQKGLPLLDLIVTLHAPHEVLRDRCASRGRSDDEQRDPALLNELVRLYSDFAGKLATPAVVAVDASGSVQGVVDSVLSAILRRRARSP